MKSSIGLVDVPNGTARSVARELDALLVRCFNASYLCSPEDMRSRPWSCAGHLWQAPFGRSLAERKSWIRFVRRLPAGAVLFPLPLEFLLDMRARDSALWRVELVFFVDTLYNSTADLLAAAAQVPCLPEWRPPERELRRLARLASFDIRGDRVPRADLPGPQLYMPRGPRYTLDGQRVTWLQWSFHFAVRPSIGAALAPHCTHTRTM